MRNFAQPIIRYYVEISVKIHDACDCGNNFPWLEINGRVSGVCEICVGAVTSIQLDDVTEIIKMLFLSGSFKSAKKICKSERS